MSREKFGCPIKTSLSIIFFFFFSLLRDFVFWAGAAYVGNPLIKLITKENLAEFALGKKEGFFAVP